LSLVIDGKNGDGVVVVVSEVVVVSVEVVEVASVVVVSVDVGDVSVEVELVSVEVESVAAVVVSAAVEVLSVVLVTIETIPRAPEASIPAQSRAPNPRTMPARRSFFRPFISPAPLLPQMRRIN
jgi:hypothetical protein